MQFTSNKILYCNTQRFQHKSLDIISWSNHSCRFQNDMLLCNLSSIYKKTDMCSNNSNAFRLSFFVLPVCPSFILQHVYKVISITFLLFTRSTLQRTTGCSIMFINRYYAMLANMFNLQYKVFWRKFRVINQRSCQNYLIINSPTQSEIFEII